MNVIDKFRGQHGFLSNFYKCDVELNFKECLDIDLYPYPSVEHAYQACKFLDFQQRTVLRKSEKPKSFAKTLSRVYKIREDWEDVKLNVMKNLLMQKFSYTSLEILLYNTKEAELIEGNLWHDNFWGNCYCSKCENIEGKNHLGKLLMEIRSNL